MKTGNKQYHFDTDVMINPIHKQKMGSYEFITLTNDSAGHGIQIIPGLGGKINQLWLNGHQIIDGYRSPDDIENDTFYHNVFLFPFVNRLENGRYHFNGKEYQFPLNEPQTGNALHGFLYDKPLELLHYSVDDNKTCIHLGYQYRAEYDYYPFNFDVDIWYRLYDSNELILEFSIRNTGTTEAPLGWGWHPYFTFHRPADEIELVLPAGKRVVVDKRMLPTGLLKPDKRYIEGEKIRQDKLDGSFRLLHAEHHQISLISDADNFKIDITPDHTFPYAHIFIPPNRQSIAVEPITSGINAFNTGDRLIRIQPGASYSGNIQVTVTNTN